MSGLEHALKTGQFIVPERRRGKKRSRDSAMRAAAMKVYSWGRGEDGQLGLGDTTDQDQPCLMDALRDRCVRQIACGSGHTVVLLEEGDVYTWGRGDDGRLGHGDNGWKYVPRRVEELRRFRIAQITCGSYHTAAVTDTGQLFTWGGGMYGKLGHGDENGCSRPALVQRLRDVKVAQVACGSRHTVALLSTGNVYTWGDRENGVCGHGADIVEGHQYTPHVVADLEGLECTQISACGFHSAALCDGQVYTWGEGKFGRLGHGNERNQPTPLRVESLVGQEIIQVSCGGFHTAAVTDRGLLFTWGGGEHGQLGHADKTNRNRPALVMHLAGDDYQRRPRVVVRPYGGTSWGPDWGSSSSDSASSEKPPAPMRRPLLQGAAVEVLIEKPNARSKYDAGERSNPYPSAPAAPFAGPLDPPQPPARAGALEDQAPAAAAAAAASASAASEALRELPTDAAAADGAAAAPGAAAAAGAPSNNAAAGAASREPLRAAAGDDPTPTSSNASVPPVMQSARAAGLEPPPATAAADHGVAEPYGGGATTPLLGGASRTTSEAILPAHAPETPSSGVVVTQITCGWSHSVALCNEGNVYTWGNGDHGKLGHGGTQKLTTPTKIESLAAVRVCGIASYNEHTAALAFPPPDEPRRVPISTSYLRDMRALRGDDTFADVIFVVGADFGESVRVPAHRAVLCARSEHFRAMFGSGMRESTEMEVSIPSIRPSVFHAILEYIYTDDIAVTADSAIELYVGADMYALHELKRRCEAILERQITVANAAELLQVSDQLNAKDLRDICIAFIVSHPLCRKSESFRALVRRGGELMVEIIDRMNSEVGYSG